METLHGIVLEPLAYLVYDSMDSLKIHYKKVKGGSINYRPGYYFLVFLGPLMRS